jgi:hypothetical protein
LLCTFSRASGDDYRAKSDQALADPNILGLQKMVDTDQIIAFCEAFGPMWDGAKFIPLRMSIMARALKSAGNLVYG